LHFALRAQLVVPEQRQLFDYWVEKAAGREMPDRIDISPSHFPRLLPYVSLIDVEAPEGPYRVRLAGTRLRDIYDREITGLCLDELDWGDKTQYWMEAYRRIVAGRKPAQGIVRGPRVQKEHLVQYWLRLPLRVGRQGVGMILSYDAFLPMVEALEAATG
jgi:hypothetical protein